MLAPEAENLQYRAVQERALQKHAQDNAVARMSVNTKALNPCNWLEKGRRQGDAVARMSLMDTKNTKFLELAENGMLTVTQTLRAKTLGFEIESTAKSGDN